MKLQEYLKDGANAQARAVLMFLQQNDGIEASWSDEFKDYQANLELDRWHNCREQGYILSLKHNARQLNIAWFEHRNSDNICALRWEQTSFPNPLTIDTAKFGNLYKDKYDVSHDVGYGEAHEMAEWIWKEFEAFYTEAK